MVEISSTFVIQIFFMICVFGLFHGLVVLPVVLATIGPQDAALTTEERAALKQNRRNQQQEQQEALTRQGCAPWSYYLFKNIYLK
jgi:hypothetical protein